MFATRSDGNASCIAMADFASDYLVCEIVANLFADQSIEWPSAISWIVTFVTKPCFCFIVDIQLDSTILQPSLELRQSDVDNVSESISTLR